MQSWVLNKVSEVCQTATFDGAARLRAGLDFEKRIGEKQIKNQANV